VRPRKRRKGMRRVDRKKRRGRRIRRKTRGK
jgi:hypothetical protein